MKRKNPRDETLVRESPPTYRIADIPETDRPRERLSAKGPESLTTAELLAILFRTGTTRRNAVQLGDDLLQHMGGLAGLAAASLEQLRQVDGVGEVKAIEVKAAIEIGKRLAATAEEARPQIHSPADVARLMMPDLRYETREKLYVLLLDSRNRVRGARLVSTGTLTESLAHPREIFGEALQSGTAGIVLVHNHPSGDPSPSPSDLAMTHRLSEAGKLLGIPVHDHVIIGDGRWASLRQDGLMPGP